jgi:hypothetical protein
MNWKEYFEKTSGKGYLATSDSEGRVDIAVYSRPHVQDDGTLAFGMTDRLTHANLQKNPHATYAFNEKGFSGVRLCLEKVREENEGPVLEAIRERADRVSVPGAGDAVKFVVYFRLAKDLPLVGS